MTVKSIIIILATQFVCATGFAADKWVYYSFGEAKPAENALGVIVNEMNGESYVLIAPSAHSKGFGYYPVGYNKNASVGVLGDEYPKIKSTR